MRSHSLNVVLNLITDTRLIQGIQIQYNLSLLRGANCVAFGFAPCFQLVVLCLLYVSVAVRFSSKCF